MMVESLEEMGFNPQVVNLNQVGASESHLISRDGLEHLNTILSETETKLTQTESILKFDPAKIEQAKNRLCQFAPYTDDVRILLCAADEALQSLLSSVSSSEKKGEIEEDFNCLIADSMRLSYIKHISYQAFHSGTAT